MLMFLAVSFALTCSNQRGGRGGQPDQHPAAAAVSEDQLRLTWNRRLRINVPDLKSQTELLLHPGVGGVRTHPLLLRVGWGASTCVCGGGQISCPGIKRFQDVAA